jgi:hypothetical protein
MKHHLIKLEAIFEGKNEVLQTKKSKFNSLDFLTRYFDDIILFWITYIILLCVSFHG